MEIYANEGLGRKKNTTRTKQMNCSSDANMHRIHRWAPLDQKGKGAGAVGKLRQLGWPRVLARCQGGLAHLSADRKVLISPVCLIL